jgi:hypothetical protein
LTEADTVVADSQPEHGRVDALEFLDVSGAAFGQSVDSLPDSAGYALIELRQIVGGGSIPLDLLQLKVR